MTAAAELPEHLVAQVLCGASPVAIWRQHRGWTVTELASRAGIFPAELRAIEERKRLLGDQAEKLAGAMGVPVGSLMRVRSGFRSCEEALADLPDL